MLENPKWYTPYTPYQPEISQGRLESLLNFQTAIMELTGMPVANASLLDEAMCAAEAVQMSFGASNQKRKKYYMSDSMFPQTIDVVRTKCFALDIELEVGPIADFPWDRAKEYMGVMV